MAPGQLPVVSKAGKAGATRVKGQSSVMQRTGSTTLSNCSRAGRSAVQEMWDSPPVKGPGPLRKVQPPPPVQQEVLAMNELLGVELFASTTEIWHLCRRQCAVRCHIVLLSCSNICM